MILGMIGLGRMGGKMTGRPLKSGRDVVVYDCDPEAIQRLLERNGLERAR